MKQSELVKKVKALIKSDKQFIDKLIGKALVSGCMDIEGAEDNYLLPKALLSAIYKEMSRQYEPLTKEGKKDAANIFVHL